MFIAETLYDDEFGNLKQYQKEFLTEEEAIKWAKLNDGAVFNAITGELVYDSIEIYGQEEV